MPSRDDMLARAPRVLASPLLGLSLPAHAQVGAPPAVQKLSPAVLGGVNAQLVSTGVKLHRSQLLQGDVSALLTLIGLLHAHMVEINFDHSF